MAAQNTLTQYIAARKQLFDAENKPITVTDTIKHIKSSTTYLLSGNYCRLICLLLCIQLTLAWIFCVVWNFNDKRVVSAANVSVSAANKNINWTPKQCDVDLHNILKFGSFYGVPSYYYKKGYMPLSSNIVLSLGTMCDINRLWKAKQISINFNGPISVSIYMNSLENEIKNQTICNAIKTLFDDINNKYDIYISLLYPDYTSEYYQELDLLHPNVPMHAKFPFNAMRNMAVSQIKTQYVSFIDVDFIYMSSTINTINNKNDKLIEKPNEKKIFVVPNFEWHRQKAEKKYLNENGYLFDTKTQILKLIESRDIIVNHVLDWEPAERCNDHDKWYNINTTKNYKVKYCTSDYEPFIIFKTEYAHNKYPWPNECIGRSMDMVLHIASLAYDCFEFEVLHDIFIIHDFRGKQDHIAYDKWGKIMNKKYANKFRTYCDNPNKCWRKHVCKRFYKNHEYQFDE
eukprot:401300_1